MQYQPESISISELGRQLGWEADGQLLKDLSNDGWEPHRFRITTSGLTVDFRFVGIRAQQYEYSSNQEGGNAESLVRDFNEIFSPKGWEVIFVYRAGTKGADNAGVYTRFLMRREIGQRNLHKFRYHYLYRKPSTSKTSKSKSWKKICTIPAHEGWGDVHPYDLLKEVVKD
jgi:hypothetical protein